MRPTLLPAALLLAGSMLAACGGSSPTPAPATVAPATVAPTPAPATAAPAETSAPATDAPATGGTAEIKGFAFDPNPVEIVAGQTVSWTNADGAAHTVTADDGSFDSGRLPNGQSFSQVFATQGTFTYHCAIHTSMKATIVVN